MGKRSGRCGGVGVKGHWAYLVYVIRHKWFVFRAGRWCGVGIWQLLIHDWTKFLPCEWYPYVGSFYNRDGTKRDWKSRTAVDKLAFNRAWNHHQKANKHHWQYWVLTNDSDDPKHSALEMPEKYRREMVADWMGAGRAITGNWEVWNWYEKNKDKILLEAATRSRVEGQLEFLKLILGRADRLGISTA